MRYRCRCNKCRGRKTLAQHPDMYLKRSYTKCQCGGTYVLDKYRMAKEQHQRPCYCDEYWFPHRKTKQCRY